MICWMNLEGLVSETKKQNQNRTFLRKRNITFLLKLNLCITWQVNTKRDCSTYSLALSSSSCPSRCFTRFRMSPHPLLLFAHLSPFSVLTSIKASSHPDDDCCIVQVLVLHAPDHDCIPLDNAGMQFIGASMAQTNPPSPTSFKSIHQVRPVGPMIRWTWARKNGNRSSFSKD